MKRAYKIIVIALLTVLCVSSVALANWDPTYMRTYKPDDPNVLCLTATWNLDTATNEYVYTYELWNQTAKDHIGGFALTFAESVPVTSFNAITKPDGWLDPFISELSNSINWFVGGNGSAMIAPNAKAYFSFRSTYAPGMTLNVNAASQDSFGFSGMTYGPVVPEPASMTALLTGLVGLAGLRLRRNKD